MNTMVKNTVLAPFNALYAVSPELCLKALFRIKQGYALDLQRPKTFSEKIQWIKLYDHNPLMPRCADKYTVRGYVRSAVVGSILTSFCGTATTPHGFPLTNCPRSAL